MDDPFLQRRLADRRELWPLRPHGPSGLPGRAQGQRRLGAARRADEADRVPQAAPAVPRPDHGDHQRRHAAPLGARFQPGAGRADQRDARATGAGSPIWSGWRSWRRAPTDAGVPRPLRRDQAGQQGAARRLHRAGGTSSRCRPTRCSTCRSSASTSTSGSCSTSWRRSRPTPTSSTAPTPAVVPRVKIFAGKAAPSYMRAKLIIKFINDVASGGERRAQGRRPAEDPVPAELQRLAWPRS